MRVHEDVKAKISSLTKDIDGVLDPLLVILTWTLVLDSFPSEDVAYSIVTPPSQAGKVLASLLDSKRSADELDVVAIEEPVRDM